MKPVADARGASREMGHSKPELSLVGSYRRFGEIGPVYEVLGPDGEGFVKICLVESGKTARYPAHEVMKDPPA